jgi:glycerol kinase
MPTPSDKLTLALDQGTHASRALVVDGTGRVLAAGVKEIGLSRPQEDWAEQDPEEVVASVEAAARQALEQLGAQSRSVAAAGLAVQRSNALCWDRHSGRALSPIFSWQDRRAHRWLRRLEPHGEAVHRKTGLFLSPHYGASKLRWALDNLPAVRQALEGGSLCWGPLASFLPFRLLRERPFLADPQCAARTQLWNLSTRDWDPELLALFGLPGGFLPRCVPTCHPYGTFAVAGVAIPLLAVNGDQSAAVFASGMPEPETAYVNIGTSAFVQRALAANPGYIPRQLTGIVLDDGRQTIFTVEGNVNGAGTALTWLGGQPGMDGLLANLPEWLERLEAPPLFLNGIAGLGGPFWQAEFASRFEGAGEPWQQAVAVVESIAFLLQANLDWMGRYLPPPVRLRVSGGVSRFDGLCRRMAALSALPVQRRDDPEATARGIAYLAAGRPAGWSAAADERVFTPRPDPALAGRYRRWRALLAQATGV